MSILQANGLRFGYGSNLILENATFHVDDGDKVGIVGPNGAGKTTLLRLISSELEPDAGSLTVRRCTELGYLEQVIAPEEKTIFSFCEEIFRDIFEMEERMRALEKRMETDAGELTMSEYGELLERFGEMGGYGIRSKVNSVLSGLKMEGGRRLSELSGGERSKVAMARLLLRNPELLILDEPTNHLDIESISWMESFLSEYRGTILVVSHDRYFLDKVCTKILHFEFGVATMYRGGYKAVMRQIMEQKAAQRKAYELQQKEIARQEGIIREFYNRATELQIKKAKSRQKLLDKMERIERPEEDKPSFHLRLKTSGRGGNEVLMMHGVSKRFGDKTVLDSADLEVFKDDKIGLIGGNGAGKTTLFKLALGELRADAGEIKFGAGIETGYFAQNMERLDWDKTIVEEVHDAYPKLTISEIRGALGAFLFKDDLDRKIGGISGGERSRIQLLKLMMSPANLLLLDEPTNHLDMYSKEMLDQALSEYEGTAVIISHDRFFLNAVCNRIAVLENGRITVYEGNYDDYLYTVSLRRQALLDAEKEAERERARIAEKAKKKARSRGEIPRRSRKAIEREITEMEEQIAELERRRYDEDIYTDFQKSRKIEEELEVLQQQCEKRYEELLELDTAE